MLPLHVVKALLQKFVIIHIGQLDPTAPPSHRAENLVGVVTEYPIEGAVLGGSDAAGGNLLDVDVGQIVGDVFLDGEGDGREGNGAAEEPAYALLAADEG